jgi:hypothetical protein
MEYIAKIFVLSTPPAATSITGISEANPATSSTEEISDNMNILPFLPWGCKIVPDAIDTVT